MRVGLSLFGTAIDIVSSVIQDVPRPTSSRFRRQPHEFAGHRARCMSLKLVQRQQTINKIPGTKDPSRVPQLIETNVLPGT